MTTQRAIERTRLIRLLGDQPVPANPRVVEAIHAYASDQLPLRAIPASELRTIYERRRMRMPDSHPQSNAVNHLLRALDGRDDDVSVVVLELPNEVVAVWLNEQADEVIGTIAGDHAP